MLKIDSCLNLYFVLIQRFFTVWLWPRFLQSFINFFELRKKKSIIVNMG